jgi:hypothetical protein
MSDMYVALINAAIKLDDLIAECQDEMPITSCFPSTAVVPVTIDGKEYKMYVTVGLKSE